MCNNSSKTISNRGKSEDWPHLPSSISAVAVFVAKFDPEKSIFGSSAPDRTRLRGLPCQKMLSSAVFLWGDEVERYNKMLQTRRIVWNIIIGVIVVGVLSNFLYAGLIVGR